MADKTTPPNDLTSTLNLKQLRAIPGNITTDEILKSLNSEQQNVVNALESGLGILLILRGAGVGGRFLLDSDSTKIGRDINNEICLDDITVSRSHALISKINGQYWIKDLGSLNGTYSNAISVKDVQINTGDEIQIGKYHMTLFVGKK
jgi:pSer/pThr/pTyr-binding forkhead associated (FHA) protein